MGLFRRFWSGEEGRKGNTAIVFALSLIPIIGATDLGQLDHILAGLDLRLSDDALRRIAQFHRDHPMPF